MTLQAGIPIGKYVVRRKLAEGGMAEIYLASSRGPEGFEKEVVIKRIRSFLASDPGFVQMFIAEARLASRLNHANLVQIFDFDKHEDTYYLAMEYVRGHSLWDVRKRSRELMKGMSPVMVAHVGAEVARGLHYAHRLTDGKGRSLGLVHRDVTPHNVLLSYEGAVKLTDFGVAKAGGGQTAAGVLKGKFAYMSPEQSRGEPVDARTDVFALGIVLWEMLTGGRLFDGDSDVAVLRAVQQSAIAPPARLNPDVPADLDAVVMRALEREPTARYQTAQELERALAHFVLQSARSVDDTDLGAWLRGLFAEELAGAEARESTSVTPAPAPAPVEAPREPTVALRKRPESVEALATEAAPAPAASPDEDANASTYVVEPRGAAVQGGPAAPVARTGAGARWAAAGLALLLVAGGGAAVVALRRPAAPAKDASVPVAQDAAPSPQVPAARPAPVPQAGPEPSPIEAKPVPPASGAVPPAPGAGAAAEPKAPAAALKAPAAVPKTPAAAPKSRAAAPKAPATGTLLIQVRPWATVFIDGKKWKDVEGSEAVKLPAGTHHLKLVHPKGQQESNVTITAGGTVPFSHNFLSR